MVGFTLITENLTKLEVVKWVFGAIMPILVHSQDDLYDVSFSNASFTNRCDHKISKTWLHILATRTTF